MHSPTSEKTDTDTRDNLTGLTDRRTFIKTLRRDCVRTASSGGLMALLVINIDQFRRVNNVFGIRMGDRVIIKLAELLKNVGRRHDLVARIGDDEFALLLPGVMNEGHVVLAATKIRRELEMPLEVENERIPIEATIGIALCPNHSTHPESLLKHAELALLKARKVGAGYMVAEPVKDLEIADTWDLEIELETAVENDELELFYQPQISIEDGRVIRAEALMRWNSPSRGLLRPGVFIPVAERTGRIRSLTQWALNTALRQSGEWREKTGQKIDVSVNMPANAFQNPQLIEIVTGAMKIWSAEPKQLTLEITESLAMSDPESAFRILEQMREAGARIAIDDFGTGYSSLSYFLSIPADELKIDQAFVRRLLESEGDQALVHVMVELGERFGLEVIAEGVETQEALDALVERGCALAQGNLIAEPLPFDEFCQWLETTGGDWKKAPGARPAERDED